MTGVTIRVEVDEVVVALQRIAAAGDRPDDLLKLIGEDLVNSTKQRFRDEKAPDGASWAPLNPLYASTKKGTGILRETGQLAGSIVWQIADGTLEVGTNRPHARVHQFGAKIVPKAAAALVFEMGGKTIEAASVTVPARAFLGISSDDLADIRVTTAEYFDAATGGALEGSF